MAGVHVVLSERDRLILEAEYRYACAAYVGRDDVPDSRDLMRFQVATQLQLLVLALRDPSNTSGPPRSITIERLGA